jgi:hypothetical protein
MFALNWNWDKSNLTFAQSLNAQIELLRQCNETLFERPDRLRTLPQDELLAYLSKCFPSKAMEYVGNSLYAPCLLAMSRMLPRSQRLYLRYEDLVRMQPRTILSTLSNFTGLTYDGHSTVESCEPAGDDAPANQQSDSSDESVAQLHEARDQHAAFFAAYDWLLEDLTGYSHQEDERALLRLRSEHWSQEQLQEGLPQHRHQQPQPQRPQQQQQQHQQQQQQQQQQPAAAAAA